LTSKRSGKVKRDRVVVIVVLYVPSDHDITDQPQKVGVQQNAS